MNLLIKTLISGAALACAGVASATPGLGFDRTGTGTAFTYTDLFTDNTDSGLSLATTLAPGSVSDFISQTTVARMSLNGMNVSSRDLGFNGPGGFEITKTLRLQETVTSFTTAPDGSATVIFGNAAQNSPEQLNIYFHQLGAPNTPADPNVVRCYDNGVTNVGCGTYTLIASAHVLANQASFTAQPGGTVGTGSFDIKFKFDFVNTAYLNISTNSIVEEMITGTLNKPSFYHPTAMFDGTSTSTGNLFKVDSSESFVSQAVPEPDTLALVGLALAFVGTTGRRRLKS